MKIDCLGGSPSLRQADALARDVEAAGFDGLWFTESGREAYQPSAVAALATSRITIGTGVAVAFPRSPMVTAVTAWELGNASEGRFVLGLGSQVKAHVKRRYSSEFAPPGPRMREYVESLQAIFAAFQEEAPLEYHGEYYDFDLLPKQWSPGPSEFPKPPIYVAAVRSWMLRMSGQFCDGVHVHPFHSRRYLDEVVRTSVEEGAARAEGGRRLGDDFTYAVPVLSIVGDTDEELEALRNEARLQIAFYGSTRTYAPVFELHGFEGVSAELHARMAKGDIGGMMKLVTDEMLDIYAVTSNWSGLAKALHEKYEGLADRLIMYFAGRNWERDPSSLEPWSDVVRNFHELA